MKDILKMIWYGISLNGPGFMICPSPFWPFQPSRFFLFSSTATSAPGPRQVESTTAGDVQKSDGLGTEGMEEGIKQ